MNKLKYLFYKIVKLAGFYVYFFPARMRALFYSLLFKKTGKNVFIFGPFRCGSPENIQLGDEVVLSNNCVIGGEFGVSIGNFVIVGPNSIIASGNHGYDEYNIPIMRQRMKGKKINIGDDVWIGANAVILPGISIGQGSVIGASSVVTKDVPPYSIAVGNPASVIKQRVDKEKISLLSDKKRSPLYKYYMKDELKSYNPRVYT